MKDAVDSVKIDFTVEGDAAEIFRAIRNSQFEEEAIETRYNLDDEYDGDVHITFTILTLEELYSLLALIMPNKWRMSLWLTCEDDTAQAVIGWHNKEARIYWGRQNYVKIKNKKKRNNQKEK